jgi:hypothetical protein
LRLEETFPRGLLRRPHTQSELSTPGEGSDLPQRPFCQARRVLAFWRIGACNSRMQACAAFCACLILGILGVESIRLQSVEIPIIGEAAAILMRALPYIIVLVVLAGFIDRSQAPETIGQF